MAPPVPFTLRERNFGVMCLTMAHLYPLMLQLSVLRRVCGHRHANVSGQRLSVSAYANVHCHACHGLSLCVRSRASGCATTIHARSHLSMVASCRVIPLWNVGGEETYKRAVQSKVKRRTSGGV